MSDHQSRRARRTRRLRSRLLQAALIVVCYYLVPVHEVTSTLNQFVRATLALIVFVVLVSWFAREVSRQTARSTTEVNQDRLFLLIVGGLVFFAVADLAIARFSPGEFADLQTKTDALYFAITTLSTVGFGDVHAQGQVARGLLIIQMVFNVVVLTRAAQTLLASRAARPSTGHDT